MVARDPQKEGRTTTPLELFFDLTFVIAYGVAAKELSHMISQAHVVAGVGVFVFATVALSWTWTQYTWFASAYDTDDWLFRGATLLQMVGMLVFALGLPEAFNSASDGGRLEIQVVTLGYVLIRLPMITQWLRAARHDHQHRPAYLRYVAMLLVAQAILVGIAFAHTTVAISLLLLIGPLLLEAVPPVWAEFASRHHSSIPWHPHHVADRYNLVVIIAMGETLFGTAATVGALVAPGEYGWTADAVALGLAGAALTFGMWWIYFIVPYGHVLESSRKVSFEYSMMHLPILPSLVAMGAGLYVAADRLNGKTSFGDFGTLGALAVPIGLFVLFMFVMYLVLHRRVDSFHLLLLGGTAGVIALSFLTLALGASLMAALVVISLAPWVIVVGYETLGHRITAEV